MTKINFKSAKMTSGQKLICAEILNLKKEMKKGLFSGHMTVSDTLRDS